MELVILSLSSELRFQYIGLLGEYMSMKGTSVGYLGGLLGSYRLPTVAFNPVQGAFFALTTMMIVPKSREISLGVFIFTIATFAKIALLGQLLIILRPRQVKTRPEYAAYAYIILLSLSLAIAYLMHSKGFDSLAGMASRNISSVLLHLQGLIQGFLTFFSEPLGVGVSSIGAKSAWMDGRVPPGFESFLGAYVAANGIICVLPILLLLLILGVVGNGYFVLFLLVLFALSDNISSPHLYILLAASLYETHSARRGQVVM
ncbi:MAG: hypothetical protein ABJ056_08695 [Halioglobus sp.]